MWLGGPPKSQAGRSILKASTGSTADDVTRDELLFTPGLYLVAMPIGNLRDITLRALDLLKRADVILCEDTRVTARLLTHYGIERPTLAYHDHNAARMLPRILDRLRGGQVVAQVTDAGTPLVSDPGYRLVQAAVAEQLPVTALPGASAPVAALTLSALPADRFLFAGFPPAKSTARRRFLHDLAAVRSTLIFFESPHRLKDSLVDMAEILGARPAAVCRELTKRFEEVRRADLPDLAASYDPDQVIKGEVVVVVAPPPDQARVEGDDLDARIMATLDHSSVRQAAADVAAQTGLPRREVYARALALRGAREQ